MKRLITLIFIITLSSIATITTISNEPTYISAQTIKSSKKIKATSIVATSKNTILSLNQKTNIKTKFMPAYAKSESLIYSSSNKNIITVNSSGEVKAVGYGSATVTITSKSRLSTKIWFTVITPTTLNVRGKSISLDDSKNTVISTFGEPGRIDRSYYGKEVYIYNDDYNKFLMIYLEKNKVIGFYTDSDDFSYMDMNTNTMASDKRLKDMAYSNNREGLYIIDDIHHYIEFYVDEIGTQKLYGIRMLKSNIRNNQYDKALINSTELQILDLTNSIRVKNGLHPLTWSEQAHKSSVNHSKDMALNNYFNHTSLDGKKSGDRMRIEGINWTSAGENISAGYYDSIDASFGWFQSQGHRDNILYEGFDFLGVGMYNTNNKYNRYYTQNFYSTW